MQKTEDPIVLKVMEDLNRRSILGLNTYGTNLLRKDYSLKDWLTELYNELLDGANYIQAAIHKIDEESNKILQVQE